MKNQQIENSFQNNFNFLIFICLFWGILLSSSTLFAQTKYTPISTGAVPIQLYVFECGRIEVRELSLFNPWLKKGIKKEMSNACYVIQHPEGALLWDAGLSDTFIQSKNGVDVFQGKINLKITQTFLSQLEQGRIHPDQIDYIAFSHLHSDHTGNAGYFKNSTWLVQKVEYELGFSKEAANYSFQKNDYSHLKNNEIIKLNGDYDVFGDGSVIILSTPGHTPGHQSLFVDLPQTGPIVLSGDLYHFEENYKNYGIPVFNTKKETIHSFSRIDQVLDQTQARLWIQHDLPQFSKMKLSPAFYE